MDLEAAAKAVREIKRIRKEAAKSFETVAANHRARWAKKETKPLEGLDDETREMVKRQVGE